MGFSVNRITLLGNLGADAEISYTRKANEYANFSLATAESWKDDDGEWQENTTWHSCVVWGRLAEFASGLKRGEKVYVEGRQEHRSYEDRETGEIKYFAQVNVQRIIRLTPKSEESDDGGQRRSGKKRRNTGTGSRKRRSAGSDSDEMYRGKDDFDPGTEDDLPF